MVVAGQGSGGTSEIRVLDATTGQLRYSIDPFANYSGEARIAVADITGDGYGDIIAAPGATTGTGTYPGPRVKVFDGRTGALFDQFDAFETSYAGGLVVAAGDTNGDGKAEVFVGPEVGRAAEIKVFESASGLAVNRAAATTISVYSTNYTGGVRLAVGDVDGDGDVEAIVGLPAPYSAVRVYDPTNGAILAAWNAYAATDPETGQADPAYQKGVYVAAGNIDGVGGDEVIVGPGGGGSPKVRVFSVNVSSSAVTQVSSFAVFSTGWTGGVRVGSVDVNGDGQADVLAGVGNNGATSDPAWRAYDAYDSNVGAQLAGGLGSGLGYTGGIYVAGGVIEVDGLPRRPAFVAGQASGGQVTVIDAVSGAVRATFSPYSGYTGAIRVAFGDVNGDGVADVVTAAGSGHSPLVKVFDGTKLADGPTLSLLNSFEAFASGFTGGVAIAVGDVDGDGKSEVAAVRTGATSPAVRIFNGMTGGLLNSYYAFADTLVGSLSIAVADVFDGDKKVEVVAGLTATGNAASVRVSNPLTGVLRSSFDVYSQASGYGVNVAAGDIDGDGYAEIFTSQTGTGAGPDVRIYSATGTLLRTITAHSSGVAVRVGAGDVNADGRADVLVVAAGSGVATDYRAYDGSSGGTLSWPKTAWGTAFTSGGWIAGGATRVDSPPTFDAGSSFAVAENQSAGAAVGTVVGHDPDGLPVAYSIVAGNSSGLFAINSTTGVITTTAPLDRESTPSYTLTIRATETARLGLWTETAITVTVTDVNENPVLANRSLSTDEGVAKEAQLTAADVDGDSLSFVLGSQALHGTATVSASGAVIYTPAPQFSGTDSFTVVVSDGNGGTATATVSVTVTGLNDPPELAPSTAFTVSENAVAGTVVGTVQATDPEGGALTYSIFGGNDDGFFTLNSATGVLTTTAPLNRESRSAYHLVVKATDAGGRWGQTNLTITVTDVNEAPTFPSSPYAFSATEGATAGTAIGRVTARDPEGTAVSYSLIAGNGAGLFTIDAATGA
ncbi:MAG: cadherin domain-containing protein, partial [Planctomycetota bacterium]|nr:cadherin domain-containing protein [Planctomycetota bacterium]